VTPDAAQNGALGRGGHLHGNGKARRLVTHSAKHWEENPDWSGSVVGSPALGRPYEIVYRDTTEPYWSHVIPVGNVTSYTVKGLTKDNYRSACEPSTRTATAASSPSRFRSRVLIRVAAGAALGGPRVVDAPPLYDGTP
jgi:hypothetical protein